MSLQVELGSRQIEARAGLDIVRDPLRRLRQAARSSVEPRDSIRDVAVDVAHLNETADFQAEAAVGTLQIEPVVPARSRGARLQRVSGGAVSENIAHDGADLTRALLGKPGIAVGGAQRLNLAGQGAIRGFQPLYALHKFLRGRCLRRAVLGARNAGNSESCQHERREQRAWRAGNATDRRRIHHLCRGHPAISLGGRHLTPAFVIDRAW